MIDIHEVEIHDLREEENYFQLKTVDSKISREIEIAFDMSEIISQQ